MPSCAQMPAIHEAARLNPRHAVAGEAEPPNPLGEAPTNRYRHPPLQYGVRFRRRIGRGASPTPPQFPNPCCARAGRGAIRSDR